MSAPSSYLRYLPAVYSTTQPAFLAQYLKIFEKILTGIGDAELGGRKGIHELLQADVIDPRRWRCARGWQSRHGPISTCG